MEAKTKIWCDRDEHQQFEYFLMGRPLATTGKNRGDESRAIKAKLGEDIVIPQHFTIDQAPEKEEELVDRNAYLLNLGITAIWFEKGQFDHVESILRLARNELRYLKA